MKALSLWIKRLEMRKRAPKGPPMQDKASYLQSDAEEFLFFLLLDALFLQFSVLVELEELF